MLENKILNYYKLQNFDGIIRLPHYFYMPVRITGLGLSLRHDDGEVVVKDRSVYEFTTRDILEHCGRLPILKDHPDDGMLNSENLPLHPIIGMTVNSWIRNTEIWGIARIYDYTLLNELGTIYKSTSPGVVSFDRLESDITVESPLEINHLAFVEAGHWDIAGSIGFNPDIKKNILDFDVEVR